MRPATGEKRFERLSCRVVLFWRESPIRNPDAGRLQGRSQPALCAASSVASKSRKYPRPYTPTAHSFLSRRLTATPRNRPQRLPPAGATSDADSRTLGDPPRARFSESPHHRGLFFFLAAVWWNPDSEMSGVGRLQCPGTPSSSGVVGTVEDRTAGIISSPCHTWRRDSGERPARWTTRKPRGPNPTTRRAFPADVPLHRKHACRRSLPARRVEILLWLALVASREPPQLCSAAVGLLRAGGWVELVPPMGWVGPIAHVISRVGLLHHRRAHVIAPESDVEGAGK